jgi:hypothetical protein
MIWTPKLWTPSSARELACAACGKPHSLRRQLFRPWLGAVTNIGPCECCGGGGDPTYECNFCNGADELPESCTVAISGVTNNSPASTCEEDNDCTSCGNYNSSFALDIEFANCNDDTGCSYRSSIDLFGLCACPPCDPGEPTTGCGGIVLCLDISPSSVALRISAGGGNRRWIGANALGTCRGTHSLDASDSVGGFPDINATCDWDSVSFIIII